MSHELSIPPDAVARTKMLIGANTHAATRTSAKKEATDSSATTGTEPAKANAIATKHAAKPRR